MDENLEPIENEQEQLEFKHFYLVQAPSGIVTSMIAAPQALDVPTDSGYVEISEPCYYQYFTIPEIERYKVMYDLEKQRFYRDIYH